MTIIFRYYLKYIKKILFAHIMRFFDFISESPKLFIFQKESNKTNLGGIFCFIYLLIVILIIIFYIYDFKNKDDYTFSYVSIDDTVFPEEREKRLNSPEFNPVLNISFELMDSNERILDERFTIFEPNKDLTKFTRLERNKFYERHINNLKLVIVFNCNDDFCKNFDKKTLKKTSLFYYKLNIAYLGKTIDHYDENSPIKDKIGNYIVKVVKECRFSFSNFFLSIFSWKKIEYIDEIGILDKIKGKQSKYITSDLTFLDSYILDDELNPLSDNYVDKNFKVKALSLIYIFVEDDKNIKYTRRRKNIWDTVGIICSLASTLYGFIQIIFIKVYSINFEPYKIIENVIYKHMKNKTNIINNKIDKLPCASQEIINDINSINIDDDETKNENLISNINEEKEDIQMPKLRMYHYILNNLYNLKKCWKSDQQQIISFCKEILNNYISIDYLLFNQIRLDNLLEDYKWNNPKLKKHKK